MCTCIEVHAIAETLAAYYSANNSEGNLSQNLPVYFETL